MPLESLPDQVYDNPLSFSNTHMLFIWAKEANQMGL